MSKKEKGQTNLSSFFTGVPPKKAQQKSLTSFFSSKTESVEKQCPSSTDATLCGSSERRVDAGKDNVSKQSNKCDDAVVMDKVVVSVKKDEGIETEDSKNTKDDEILIKDSDENIDEEDEEEEDDEEMPRRKTKKSSNDCEEDSGLKNPKFKRIGKNKRRRRIVEDDDSSDEENEEWNEELEDVDMSENDELEDIDMSENDDSDDDCDNNESKKETASKKIILSKSGPSTKEDKAPPIKKKKGEPEKENSSFPSDEKILEKYTEKIKSAKHQHWESGKSAPYLELCETFGEIEAITSRLEIQRILTDLFRLALLKHPKDLLELVYLASNSVAAAYECVELGIGDAILIKAIGEASGTNPSMIKQKYEAEGDLGFVAKNAKAKQRTLGFGKKPKPLMASEVLSVLRQIAMTSGAQSQKWKVDKIKGLLVRAQDGIEAKYIIRSLQGKLRIGLAHSTVLISLSHAITLSSPIQTDNDRKENNESIENKEERSQDVAIYLNKKLPIERRLESAVNIVKKAYSQVSSFDALVGALLSVPLVDLGKMCCLKPGLPVEPMLAKPTKSIQEVLNRLNGKRFTCEFKYDGERAQVHMSPGGVTKVFSRSLLDTSEKYPEVPDYVKEACASKDVESFVLDTEVVAYNRETKQFVPFQILSTRKKSEVKAEDAKVKVIVQAFDLMFLNGNSLLDKSLSIRRSLMHEHFQPVEGRFQFATSIDHNENGDTLILEEFLDTAVKSQCEGLMVKTLDDNATYQPSNRSLNWLKLKKDYLEGMGDSVDLVPIGAYYGRGKRTGVYGAYLLACYDVDTEEFQSVCKIGTGFSDEDLKTLSDELKEHIIPEKTSQYNTSDSLKCDVWFDACKVWEVKAADLSKSSSHKGAVNKTGEIGRGIGLRFPRFERIRGDKKPEQATTSDQILEMYYAQDSIQQDEKLNLVDEGI